MTAGKGEGPKYEVRKGRLMLRFSLNGVRYSGALGWIDNERNRKFADVKVQDIVGDILKERFDYSDRKLTAYVSRSVVGKEPVPAPAPTPLPAWVDVLEAHLESRRDKLSPSTVGRFLKHLKIIERCPHPLEEPQKIRSWIKASTTPGMASRILKESLAACEWAIEEGMLKDNPLRGQVIHHKPSKKGTMQIEYWERHERDAIINGFYENYYYSWYGPLVEFLFLTGCRPSEALGLRWSNVLDGGTRVVFNEALVGGEGGKPTMKAGLKTEVERTVRLGPRSSELIVRIAESADSESVFVGPRGAAIDWSNFRVGPWYGTLRRLGYPKKKPYSTRHTMITLALRGDKTVNPPIEPMPIADIAAMVGNSPEIILRHYAGVAKDLRLSE